MSKTQLDVALTIGGLAKSFYVDYDREESKLTLTITYGRETITIYPVRQTAEEDIVRLCPDHAILTVMTDTIHTIADIGNILPFVRFMDFDHIQDTTGYHTNPVAWAQAQAKASLLVFRDSDDDRGLPEWFPVNLVHELDRLVRNHCEAISDAVYLNDYLDDFVEMDVAP